MSNKLLLKSSPKIFKNYKSKHPAQTILAIKKSLKKLGIDLNNLKYSGGKIGEDFSIYSGEIVYKGQYIAAGKGISNQLSEASAYAETAERIPHNMSPLNSQINRQIDLKGTEFRGYSHGAEEKIKNAVGITDFFKHFPVFNVEEIKKGDSSKDWIDAFSLTDNKYKKVPHVLIREISGSNGCAAGNTLEEAISQAFCEVCERYSLIEHVTKKLSAPTVDPATIKDKNIHKAIDLFNSMNIDVEIKDLTLGNKVPVMGVLFTNQNLAHEEDTLKKKIFHKTLHAGSHLDLNLAIMRCFVEEWQTSDRIIQTFMYHREINIIDKYFSQNEKQKIISNFKKDFNPLMVFNRSMEDFDFIDEHSPQIPFKNLSSYSTTDFLKDIEIIKDISKNNSWDTMIIDYSIPELPLRIIRAVIPSISDTLKFYYKKTDKIPYKRQGLPSLKFFSLNKKIDIKELISSAKKTYSFKNFLLNKNLNAKELIPIAERELIENVITPYPKVRTLEYSPFEILTVLKSSYFILGNREKGQKVDNLLRFYSE